MRMNNEIIRLPIVPQIQFQRALHAAILRQLPEPQFENIFAARTASDSCCRAAGAEISAVNIVVIRSLVLQSSDFFR